MNGFPPSSEYNHHLMYYVYVCVKEKESIASTLGKFQLHSTVWSTLVTMLHIKSSDLLFILLLKVCTLLQHLLISPTPQPLATTFLFCEFDLPFVYLYSCCSCLVAKSCPTHATPWNAARQAPLSSFVSWSLLRFIPVESVMLSNRLILCCSLLFLPSLFLSIRVFSIDSALCSRLPKYWSFSISPSSDYSRLISFRTDRFDLFDVQGTLKSLHRSSKSSMFQHSAFFMAQLSPFFMVQLSHPHMTTGKTIALTRWTFVDKVISLLFNMLSRFVIAFLPRSKHLLI